MAFCLDQLLAGATDELGGLGAAGRLALGFALAAMLERGVGLKAGGVDSDVLDDPRFMANGASDQLVRCLDEGLGVSSSSVIRARPSALRASP